jgi:hypothetical protein
MPNNQHKGQKNSQTSQQPKQAESSQMNSNTMKEYDKDGSRYLKYVHQHVSGLMVDDKYFQMSVKSIKERCLPQLELEMHMHGHEKIRGEMNDEMEYSINLYQLICHTLAYFYLYGSYVSYIDLDLYFCVSILLARKVIARVWLYIAQFRPTLTTKVWELERQDRLKQQQEPQ